MKPYLVKTPKFVQRLFPKRIWAFPTTKKEVYLTFDDGPIPEVTPWVLSLLKEYQAKATFFCIGENINKHPVILKKILSEGHSIGNHTFNHLNGWRTETEEYIQNCELFEQILNQNFDKLSSTVQDDKITIEISNNKSKINNQQSPITNLFRPPFGKLTSKQSKILLEKGYKIIMWEVLSADFDKSISKEKCLENVISNIQPGSIVVFHDSLKSEEKLRYVLPKVLEYINSKKWKCTRI